MNLQGCRNGNVCDVYSGDVYLCKAPLGANCRDVTDCSNTIIDPLCTLEGGQNGNRICAVTAAAPGASQLVERRKRNVMRSKISRNLDNQCPLRTIACPTASGNSFECVNTAEEVSLPEPLPPVDISMELSLNLSL